MDERQQFTSDGSSCHTTKHSRRPRKQKERKRRIVGPTIFFAYIAFSIRAAEATIASLTPTAATASSSSSTTTTTTTTTTAAAVEAEAALQLLSLSKSSSSWSSSSSSSSSSSAAAATTVGGQPSHSLPLVFHLLGKNTTGSPTTVPSFSPSTTPIPPTTAPTTTTKPSSTTAPSTSPTISLIPTSSPTTISPTTSLPSHIPTPAPSFRPSHVGDTIAPTQRPSPAPSISSPPSHAPSLSPTTSPTFEPTIAPTVETIAYFKVTQRLAGITLAQVLNASFERAFANITATLLSLPSWAITILDATAVSNPNPSSLSSRAIAISDATENSNPRPSANENPSPTRPAGGGFEGYERLIGSGYERLIGGYDQHIGVAYEHHPGRSFERLASSEVSVDFTVRTFNQPAAYLASVLKTGIGALSLLLQNAVKISSLVVVFSSYTDLSPTYAPSPEPSSAPTPLPMPSASPTFAAPTVAPTTLIDSVAGISKGLMVGLIVGAVCLCCFVVAGLTIADESDWCGTFRSMRARLGGPASELVPEASAVDAGDKPAAMGYALGKPRGRMMFNTAASKVYMV